jgi:MacB-like periplasmic core domain/FtsX-like permease family
MSGLLTDFRFGLRALLANRVFVLLAVLCLSLGTGASAMTFTVINDALLGPLGPIDPEGLVAIGEVRQTAPNDWWPVSSADFLDWRSSIGGRAELGALRASSFDVGSSEADQRVEGIFVTDDLPAVLGVAPILGRGLQAGDAAATGEPVVALSETFWRQRFGGDRTIVGRTVRIDGEPHTVVGVVPALLAVGMPTTIRSARVWVPLRADSHASRDDRSLFVIARLAAGTSVESFAEQMRSIAHELATLYPEDADWSVGVGPLGGSALGGARSLLLLSVGAALLVLLIACANVANLSLAQGTRRRHEFAIRTAIGASPWRIARQLLCESSLVVVLGAVFGLLIARGGLGVIAQFYAADSLAPAALPIDARSLAFTIGLTFATTALVGLFPAIEAARGATRAQIAESGFGATTARARDGLRAAVGLPDGTAQPGAGPVIAYVGVTPSFFATLEIPLLRGRSFGENAPSGRVAVVNETLAKLLWPNENPVGRQLRLDADPERGWVTVVGVSGDVLTWDSNGAKPLPTAYFDAKSFDAFPVFFFIHQRSAGQIIGAESISRAIGPLGLGFRRIVVTPMEQVARDPFWRQQVFSLWFTVVGVAALTLTAIGIYGVLAYLVWQRWREIGIRMALGADRRSVLLMVWRHGAAFVGLGIVIGLVGAVLLATTMRGLLFGVAPLDVLPYIAVTVFLAVVAMAASAAPAFRAARIDPHVLLSGDNASRAVR